MTPPHHLPANGIRSPHERPHLTTPRSGQRSPSFRPRCHRVAVL
jgi:hypothetical protein